MLIHLHTNPEESRFTRLSLTAGCSEADREAIKDTVLLDVEASCHVTLSQEGLQSELEHFQNLSIGGQIMKQLRFGWELLLTHRSVDEAHLHFAGVMAKYPDSDFLLRELAAAAVLTNALPEAGDDGLVLHRAVDGTWTHLRPSHPTIYAVSLERWEMYAAIRFKSPKAFLSEAEPQLLAAGMPPHAFVPVGQWDSSSSTADTTGNGFIFEHRLRHDKELFRLLESMGLLAKGVAQRAIEAYERTLRSAPRVNEGLLQPTGDQWHGLYPFHNRRLYIHPCPRIAETALNPVASMETKLFHSPSRKATALAGGFLGSGGVLVIDNILSSEALKRLRDFAELSTIWYHEQGNFLAAGLNTGFATPLLAQVAEEFRELLQDVLCDLPLTDLRAVKFDDVQEVDLQADQAAVTVNLWITADELDDSNSGLTIYDASAGLDVFAVDSLSSTKSILEELVRGVDGENVSVPYRQNRAVVYESTRIHSAQPFPLRKSMDLRSRMISLAFLFGSSGLHCIQRRMGKVMLENQAAQAGM